MLAATLLIIHLVKVGEILMEELLLTPDEMSSSLVTSHCYEFYLIRSLAP
jgi:hypothetical protein